MNKKIKFEMDEDFFIIIVGDKDPYKISKKERTLNAEKIFNLLDYSVGDTYSFDCVDDYGKETLVLNKIKEIFEKITSSIMNLEFEKHDAQLNENIAKIVNKNKK